MEVYLLDKCIINEDLIVHKNFGKEIEIIKNTRFYPFKIFYLYIAK